MLLLSCFHLESIGASYVESGQAFMSQQCQAFFKDEIELEFKFSLPNAQSHQRNKALYLFNKKANFNDWLIIDTSSSKTVTANTLKLPLHSLKYKKYLAGRKLLLLGDGKNYNELEQTAVTLKKYLVEEVKIYHGGIDAWLEKTKPVLTAKVLLPAEFIAESKYGQWNYIQTQAELKNLLVDVRKNNTAFSPLARFLLTKPNLLENHIDIAPSLSHSLFEIKGGLKALEQYTKNQGIILSAQQTKKARSQCKQPYDS